jgi:hypothetical protein
MSETCVEGNINFFHLCMVTTTKNALAWTRVSYIIDTSNVKCVQYDVKRNLLLGGRIIY